MKKISNYIYLFLFIITFFYKNNFRKFKWEILNQ